MYRVVRIAALFLCCAGWTVAYISAIQVGFCDRTYGIPAVSIALNFAWESINAGYRLIVNRMSEYQYWFILLWTVLDLGIIYTFLVFGRNEFPTFISRLIFAWASAIILFLSYVFQTAFIIKFPFDLGVDYAAFLQNVLMSGLFIAMFINRRGTRGQNMTIAISKWIGTLAATIARPDPLLRILGIICCILDMIYIALVAWANQTGGVLLKSERAPIDSDLEVVGMIDN